MVETPAHGFAHPKHADERFVGLMGAYNYKCELSMAYKKGPIPRPIKKVKVPGHAYCCNFVETDGWCYAKCSGGKTPFHTDQAYEKPTKLSEDR